MDSATWWVFEKEGERGFQAHELEARKAGALAHKFASSATQARLG